MISRSDDPYAGLKRTFRIAILVSLLVHPLIIALLMTHFDFRHPTLRAEKPPQKTETVTISSAPKHAVKTIAKVEPLPNRPVPQSAQHPKEVRTVPHPQEIANTLAKQLLKPISVPTFVPPIPQKHELAKLVPVGTPVPRVAPTTVRTPAPVTPPPQTPPPTTQHEKAVAYQEKPSEAHPSKHAKYSDAQIAEINSELAKSIQGTHGYDAPLSDERKQIAEAEAPKHYTLDFHALNGAERYAQGLCDPIKEWDMNGYDYYYESCNVLEPDGTMNRKPVPWPVRYPANNDPFTETSTYRGTIPLAVPLPGWHADPAHPIDPDFIPYLRARGYAI